MGSNWSTQWRWELQPLSASPGCLCPCFYRSLPPPISGAVGELKICRHERLDLRVPVTHERHPDEVNSCTSGSMAPRHWHISTREREIER